MMLRGMQEDEGLEMGHVSMGKASLCVTVNLWEIRNCHCCVMTHQKVSFGRIMTERFSLFCGLLYRTQLK